jgi:hypothetical protein
VLELWPGRLARGGGGQYPPGGNDGQYQLEAALEAKLKSARLWEILPTASRVLDLYENPVI